MFRTRWIRKLLARSNSQGHRRRQMAKTRKPVRLRLEALEDRVVPDATTVVVDNITVNFFGSSQSPAFIMPVTVNDNSGGTATSGTVTINLVENNTTTVLGSATVGSNGVANVSISTGDLPSDMQPGTFTLEESFSGSGDFDASSANGTLTILALSTSITPVTVTITATNTTSVTETTNTTLPLAGVAGDFTVLYEGTGGETLHIANSTINGNVGVGGTGVVHLSGPDTINGDLDFSASSSGQLDEDGKDQSGPSAINFNDAAVTSALNAVNALSTSLAGLGTNIAINGTETINESDGLLVTINGVSYRVFNVTSFHMDDDDVLTIQGDGSGIPVVFNFGGKGNVNLGGDVTLTNGLTPDQVLWNFSGSGGKVHLAGDADHSPSLAFEGIILAPNDKIDLDHVNIIGRVFGGDATDMQINGDSTITAPTPVATVTTTTTTTFTITVAVNSPTVTVTSGTVTLEVLVGNETIVLGSATVGSNSTATITVTNPNTLQEIASLSPGTFEIIVTFSGGNGFAGSAAPGTLVVTPSLVLPALGTSTPSSGGGGNTSPTTPPGLSPIVAALELALEAALLENLNNPGAVGEAELFSQVFLGHTIPATVPELMQSIPGLVPQAGPMLGPALGFASFLGPELAIENPMKS